MTEDTNSGKTLSAELVDELTDGLAVITIALIAIYGEPTQAVLVAIASIAIGKNYLRSR